MTRPASHLPRSPGPGGSAAQLGPCRGNAARPDLPLPEAGDFTPGRAAGREGSGPALQPRHICRLLTPHAPCEPARGLNTEIREGFVVVGCDFELAHLAWPGQGRRLPVTTCPAPAPLRPERRRHRREAPGGATASPSAAERSFSSLPRGIFSR